MGGGQKGGMGGAFAPTSLYVKKGPAPSIRYATKCIALKIFDSWRAARKVKEVKIDDAGHETDDIGPTAQSRH